MSPQYTKKRWKHRLWSKLVDYLGRTSHWTNSVQYIFVISKQTRNQISLLKLYGKLAMVVGKSYYSGNGRANCFPIRFIVQGISLSAGKRQSWISEAKFQ